MNTWRTMIKTLSHHDYLTGEDILPSNQQQIIEQAKFTYSPLGKAFEKQIKMIEDQGKKTGWCFRKIEGKRTNKINWINFSGRLW